MRPDVNVRLVMDMVAGAALFNVLFQRVDPADLPAKLEPLVDTIWSGIRNVGA